MLMCPLRHVRVVGFAFMCVQRMIHLEFNSVIHPFFTQEGEWL